MLLIECNKVKKYFGDRLILDIEHLKIFSEDKIGIVGVNGAGKTTLIRILNQTLEVDEGMVRLYGKHSYISQLEPPSNRNIKSEIASKFRIPYIWEESMSGGEKTRFKFAQGLSANSPLILADEPTSNMDMEGIELMETMLKEYKGALVLVTHDRNFLDNLCNKIWEIVDGKINIYAGSYSEYLNQKQKKKERDQFEYLQFIKKKKRLEQAIDNRKRKSKSIRKTPKRMGNSEARLHKMGNQKAKSNLNKAVKSIESRIEKLEVKKKPDEQERIKMNMQNASKLYSKIVIQGKDITMSFDDKILFKDAEFSIYNGSKVALLGSNGCGKSTLIKMIMNNEDSICVAQGAKIGYFSQDMSILKDNMTIIENVMENSMYQETYARILLARLLFVGEDVYKKVNILSGGERVKVSFAKILLQDTNFLILDEPTNYMDISSLEVVEEALREYNKTLLFVTHDRKFIDSVADHIMSIENFKIKMFKGSYKEYHAFRNKCINSQDREVEKQIFLLQNQLSEIVGRLSIPSGKEDAVALDKKYHKILEKLTRLKDNSPR